MASNGQKWVGHTGDKHPIDSRVSKVDLNSSFVGVGSEEVKEYLLGSIAIFQDSRCDLELIKTVESPQAKHFLFQQKIDGIDVFRGTVKVNVDLNGMMLSKFDGTVSPELVVGTHFPSIQQVEQGLRSHYSYRENGKLDHFSAKPNWFFNGENLVPTVHLEVAETGVRHYEMILDEHVKVIYQNDLLAYHHEAAQDSPVSAVVFLPDPLTTAGEEYGSPYTDQDDANTSTLNGERVWITMDADFNGTFFSLTSPYVSFNEHTDPVTTAPVSAAPSFDYGRGDDSFEFVNVFYHLNQYQEYIQSLGFNNIVNYQISVDPHGLNGADNSNFNSAFNPPRLTFGDGGVDDAEDADVIIHEYGHAIMHSAAPGTNSGTERRTLDEANGDYLAASYSRSFSEYGWDRVYTWDGHNEFWPGRSAVSGKHYPENMVSNIYTDADMWSATIMQIWGDVGREIADACLLQSAYSYAADMTMTDAAMLYIQADELLFNGDNFIPIRQRMFDRGFIPWNVGVEDQKKESGIQMLGSAGFTDGSSAVIFKIPTGANLKCTVLDMTSKVINTFEGVRNQLTLQPEDFRQSGVYLVQFEGQKINDTFKLIRLAGR